ncbi:MULTISPECIES: SH3 domain-containing protein [unclassified Leptospira]|uniref:SH3 domain-containing protein n=1 Tax=unclassified Leptospira TaxID=2633828 RepID=UPI0002BEB34A|nr:MULTISPECIES: SH3 domain-containing protein [unclassified Leptospira]EMJ97797.1 SH3 domain protein [Leptospira sp. B5-022]MCR1795591.1 SH3 domain-containing protein [Leptospira sp. id769339]
MFPKIRLICLFFFFVILNFYYCKKESNLTTEESRTIFVSEFKGTDLKSEPSSNSESIGTISYGEKVEVVEKLGNKWIKIRWNNKTGWIVEDKSAILIDFESIDVPYSLRIPETNQFWMIELHNKNNKKILISSATFEIVEAYNKIEFATSGINTPIWTDKNGNFAITTKPINGKFFGLRGKIFHQGKFSECEGSMPFEGFHEVYSIVENKIVLESSLRFAAMGEPCDL